MVFSLTSISSLAPNSFRVHLRFKVVELILSLETNHETLELPITIYEYLVADDSGCIILNTKSALKVDSVYEIQDGHTRVIENYLRLYTNKVTPSSTSISTVNTHNNRSFIHLERKA